MRSCFCSAWLSVACSSASAMRSMSHFCVHVLALSVTLSTTLVVFVVGSRVACFA
nr:MAG TPA: hypothetical protein [Inoviridae sp.]